jgi:hypothetical protein
MMIRESLFAPHRHHRTAFRMRFRSVLLPIRIDPAASNDVNASPSRA